MKISDVLISGLVLIIALVGFRTYEATQQKPVQSMFASGKWKVVGIHHEGHPTASVALVLQSQSGGRRERLTIGSSHKDIGRFLLIMPSDTVTFKHTTDSQEVPAERFVKPPGNYLVVQSVEGVTIGK